MANKNSRTDRPTTETTRTNRPMRVSTANSDDILAVQGKDPKFNYRFINDEGSKLQRAYNAWYVHVLAKDVTLSIGGGDAVQGDDGLARKRVGTSPDGSTLYAYLMRIEKKYYEEDAAKKQDKVLKAETATTSIKTEDGQYAPK